MDAKRTAELADDDRDGARIGGRSGHKEDQRGSGAEPLGDQGSGDRGTRGCADVEGNADQHHDGVGQPAGILIRHQIARNHQKEQSSQDDTHQQRKEYVVRYLDETVAKDVLGKFLEVQTLPIRGHTARRRISGGLSVNKRRATIEIRL